MTKKNALIGLLVLVLVVLAVVVLVPYDSGYQASAVNRHCPPVYGYSYGIRRPCRPRPRPLLYKLFNIGDDQNDQDNGGRNRLNQY